MADLTTDEIVFQAKKAYEEENFLEAARWFSKAVETYSNQADALSAAEMSNNRSVALLKGGDPQQALSAALGTDQVFADANDIRRQAMALGNIASAQEGLHDFAAAQENYRRSADLFKEIGEQELRVYVLERLSALQFRKGKRIEALLSMETALDSKKKLSARDRLFKRLDRDGPQNGPPGFTRGIVIHLSAIFTARRTFAAIDLLYQAKSSSKYLSPPG